VRGRSSDIAPVNGGRYAVSDVIPPLRDGRRAELLDGGEREHADGRVGLGGGSEGSEAGLGDKARPREGVAHFLALRRSCSCACRLVAVASEGIAEGVEEARAWSVLDSGLCCVVQAQNEAQRLTHALHEEKQRADAAEARADKLVSWLLAPPAKKTG
jgi:hypothetical protein